MKKRYKLKFLHIYLIELIVILCIFSMFKISRYYSEKEAVERGDHIHLWHGHSSTLNKQKTPNDYKTHKNKRTDAFKNN